MTQAFLDSESDTSSDSILDDTVLVSPSLGHTDSDWADLEIIDGQPISSEDDDWYAVSPGLHAHRPASLPSTSSVSHASTQAPSPLPFIAPPSTGLPSPPLTPLVPAFETRDEAAGWDRE